MTKEFIRGFNEGTHSAFKFLKKEKGLDLKEEYEAWANSDKELDDVKHKQKRYLRICKKMTAKNPRGSTKVIEIEDNDANQDNSEGGKK